jgi:hypothetical protein
MSAMPATATTNPSSYPATLAIDYPDRKLNRLTSFFRILVVIPIAVILGMLTGSGSGANWGHWHSSMHVYSSAGAYAGVGYVFLPLVLMILFRKKYPKWWFDWNLALSRFSFRVGAYLWLLTDVYPSTYEEQSVHLDLTYPDAQNQLGRGWPLIKWFLAIPHIIVLLFLLIAACFVWVAAWVSILFTGRYPRSLFDFIVGVARWWLRVSAYAMLLRTDQYPPFSLEP